MNRLHKAIVWGCIAIVGVTCAILSVVFSIDKTYYWQITLVIHYMFALMIEVFVFESWDCFVSDIFIPYFLFRKQIAEALATVLSVAAELFSEDRDVNVQKEENVLNAPSYLYLSSAVADSYPDLIESAIVKSYHSVFPDKYSSKWAHLVPPTEFDSCCNVVWEGIKRIVVNCINMIHVMMSRGMRKLMVHAMLPIVVMFVIFHFDDDIYELLVSAIYGFTILLVIALFFRYNVSGINVFLRSIYKRTQRKVIPVLKTHDKGDDSISPDEVGDDMDLPQNDVKYYLDVNMKGKGKVGKYSPQAKSVFKVAPGPVLPFHSSVNEPNSSFTSVSPVRNIDNNAEHQVSTEFSSYSYALKALEHSPPLRLLHSAGGNRSLHNHEHDNVNRVIQSADGKRIKSSYNSTPYDTKLGGIDILPKQERYERRKEKLSLAQSPKMYNTATF